MPKLLDDFFENNKPKIILTEHQRKLFLKELLEHGDLDSFCQAKKAITKNGLYVSVINMPIWKYLATCAPEYQFYFDSPLQIPYIFWRLVYEQIKEDSKI